MEVRIPEDCVFNAKEPAACEWYFTGLGLLGDLLISCLSEAMPERATAAHYGDSMVAAFFNMDKKDDSWISVEATAGGWGGTVGAGLEFGFAPNWSLGVEYDHLFMGTRNINLNDPTGAFFQTESISQDVDIGLVRLNYRFGGWGAPTRY